MLKVDTIKLNIPLQNNIIKKLNLNHQRIEKYTTEKKDEEALIKEITTHTINCSGVLGLNTIKIHSNDTCSIQISAKTLKQNYKDLISNDNIEQALNQVNELECFQINIPEAIEHAIAFRVDPCIDIVIPEGYNKTELFNVLSSIANRHYCLRPYDYDGLTISKNAKSNKTRLCIYDKMEEVIKDHELLMVISQDDFKNKIRVELNLRSFRHAKKYMDCPKDRNIKLTEALSSNQAPCRKFWDEFEKPVPHAGLYDDAWTAKDVNEYHAMIAQRYFQEKNLQRDDQFKIYSCFHKEQRLTQRYMKKTVEPMTEFIKRKSEPKFNMILSHFKECLKVQERN